MSATTTLFMLLAAVTCGSASACPFSATDPILRMREFIDLAIVRINTNGPGHCAGVGTGFFINRAGRILTAGHVVPQDCDASTAINVRWETTPGGSTLSAPVQAKVVQRSSLDVAVLELVDAPTASNEFLSVAPASPQTLKNACMLLASHYYEQNDSYTTFAEIASVSLDSDQRWALSGEGFNPSRSGSPVVNSEGQVVAIFLAKPADPVDRLLTIQSRAYIYPLSRIPKSEINLEDLGGRDFHLSQFYTAPGTAVVFVPQRLLTSFGVSITENGLKTDLALPTYTIDGDGELVKRDSLAEALLHILFSHGSLVRQTVAKRKFDASPGYVFDPTTVRLNVASINPRKAPRPSHECTGVEQVDCFTFSGDKRTVEFRFMLFPGYDGTRAWLDAEVHIAQVKQ